MVDRDRLGTLGKVGQGGQGVVYQAPNGRTKFASSIVYKEYKADTLAEIDFVALAAMPALVETSLLPEDAEHLISLAAWPCAIVETNGAPTGFVMPAIPERFFLPITTVKGVEQAPAEFQHLLNEPEFVVARGIGLNDGQRYALLREIASALTFLHRHDICVGDISPKNLLFSLAPAPAVYFVDCDTMRVKGVSALPQVETPGWEVPAGEELATVYSDAYKLGLLALRLLVGDQDIKDPQPLPPTTPKLLRRIITDTLEQRPPLRPLPQAWTYVLEDLVDEPKPTCPTAPAHSVPPATLPSPLPSPKPTLRSRPSARRTRAPQQSPAPASKVRVTPAASSNKTTIISRSLIKRLNTPTKVALSAAAVVAAVVISVMAAHSGNRAAPTRGLATSVTATETSPSAPQTSAQLRHPDISPMIYTTCTFDQAMRAVHAENPEAARYIDASPPNLQFLRQFMASTPDQRVRLLNAIKDNPGADNALAVFTQMMTTCVNY